MRHRPVLALALLVLVLAAGAPPHVAAADADAPTGVAVAQGESRLVVTWGAPTSGTAPTGYRVYRVMGTGDALLAELPASARRHVDTGLPDGATRAYRVSALRGVDEASSDAAQGTTFAPTTTSSSFVTGAEGFTLERSGGGTVAWSSSNGAILVTQPSGASASDTILSRALPATWTSEDTDFHVSAVVTRVQGGHDADFWALALAPAGTGDLASRPGTMGIRIEENTQTGGDGGHGVHFMFVGTDGTRLVDVQTEMCFDCALRTTYRVSLAYDSTNRTLAWTVMSDDGAFASSQHVVGSRAADLFDVTRLAIASDTPPASGTAQHTVDDVVVTWKRAESTPTSPTSVAVTRTGAGAALLTWAAPRRAGTEPVVAYDIVRGGAPLASVAGTSFSETGLPRWSWSDYQVLARSELGAGWPASARLAPEAGERVGAEGFDVTPRGWTGASDGWPSDSSITVRESSSALALSFDTVGSARYGVSFDGATWRPDTGSFSAGATYRDPGNGRATGACPLALLPAGTNACTGPGIVAEFRAENRTAASPPTMRLRFVDAAGATKLEVRHALAHTGTWRVNATYDHATRELTMRLGNATGVLLAQGSVIVAADAFALGFAGVTAGIGSHGSSPAEGVGFVEDFAYAFAAPQPAGLPAQPTDVAAEPLNADGRALVTWGAPAGGPSVDRYHVYRLSRTGDWAFAGSTTSTSFEDSGLGRRQPITYRVSAVGAAGEGLPEGRASILTVDVPGIPRPNAARTGNHGELRVVWGVPTSDGWGDNPFGHTITSYEVRRDGELVATLDASTRTLLDTGLAAGRWYRYEVRALNGVGPGPYGADGEWSPDVPWGPSSVTVSQGPTPGMVNLTWGASENNGGLSITAYRVTADGVVLKESMERWFQQDGFPQGAMVRFEVSAVNQLGPSVPVVRNVPIASPSGAPGALTAAPTSLGKVAVAWDAPASDGGLPIQSYRVYRTLAGSTSLAATVTSRGFNDSGLPHEADVAYEVAAVTAVGEGERASAATRTFANVVPGAVRDLAAARVAFGTNRVSWELPLANAGPPIQELRVYRLGGVQGETLAATLAPTARSFLDTPLQWARQPSIDYAYRVVAVNEAGAGASEWTEPVSPLL